jgi:hypothetical protein
MTESLSDLGQASSRISENQKQTVPGPVSAERQSAKNPRLPPPPVSPSGNSRLQNLAGTAWLAVL